MKVCSDGCRRQIERLKTLPERLEERRRLLNMTVIFFSEADILLERHAALAGHTEEALHLAEARAPSLISQGQAVLARLPPDSDSAVGLGRKVGQLELCWRTAGDVVRRSGKVLTSYERLKRDCRV